MSCFAHLTSEMFLTYIHTCDGWGNVRTCEVKLPKTFFWILFKSIRGFDWMSLGKLFNISSFISARLKHINENPWRAELIWEALNGNTSRTFEMTLMIWIYFFSFFLFSNHSKKEITALKAFLQNLSQLNYIQKARTKLTVSAMHTVIHGFVWCLSIELTALLKKQHIECKCTNSNISRIMCKQCILRMDMAN